MYIESIIKGNGMGIRERVVWLHDYMSVVMVTQSAILVPVYQFSIWLGHGEGKKMNAKWKVLQSFLLDCSHWIEDTEFYSKKIQYI